jgi:hypothetical protein
MKKTLLLASLSLISSAYAYEAKITKGTMSPELDALLVRASVESRVNFSNASVALIEERELATSNYRFYVQVVNNVPVEKTAVRIWSDKKTGELILAEMHLDEKAQAQAPALIAKFNKAKFTTKALASLKLKMAINKIAAGKVSKHRTDARIIGVKSKDVWRNGDLVRIVEVRARRGVHTIAVSLLQNKIVSDTYTEFPQSEAFHTLKANIFPMYEEVEGTGQKLPFEVKELKYISKSIPSAQDPLRGFTKKYNDSDYDTIRAELGDGSWSQASMRKEVESYVAKLPTRDNDLASGLLLQGKYATINIHPEVRAKIPGVEFDLKNGPNHVLGQTYMCDVDNDGNLTYADAMKCRNSAGELLCDNDRNGSVTKEEVDACPAVSTAAYFPRGGLYGKPISSQEEVMNRIPVRLPDHDAAKYINGGFDELQVYWSVTVLMEALAEMGFTDKELSTRPFHAFLFDPDIGMRDNAYYTDDTINFTTYNPGMPNLARDNPTIWHELGHGVMDRLMGGHLGFAGTSGGYGGLSEGMADFIAKLVVEHQTEGKDFPGKNDFRIENVTGFDLTNEFHDEGEAYGGAMKDMLAVVVAQEGRQGLVAFTELTLEAMRLTRNHPALTASGWFEHMLYADELGSAVRAQGQYKDIIVNSLSARNFSFAASFRPAEMVVKFNDNVLTDASEASRNKPLTPCDASGVVSFDLKVSLSEGESEFITFPATVKVEYKKGALQGAVKWIGEENNPHVYTVNSAEEILSIPVKASMECDSINQPDGSCKDYAYLQVFTEGAEKPVAKKRFYLQIQDKSSCK